MNTGTVSTEPVSTKFEMRAVAALRALLSRVSAIKLLDLKHESDFRCESRPVGRSATVFARAIFAHIDVFGHSHTLACAVIPDGEPSQLRTQLRTLPRELETGAAPFAPDASPLAVDAVPFVIAPYLSPEAQALLKQSNIGFLDFEGNARLNVGEVFISMRSLSRGPDLNQLAQLDEINQAGKTDQSALLYAFPPRPAPIAIVPTTSPVPSALPNYSRNRVGSVAVPA